MININDIPLKIGLCTHSLLNKKFLKRHYDRDKDIYIQDVLCYDCGGFYSYEIKRVK